MDNLNLELYKKLYLIRRSEEKIIEHYHEDEMKTPMHMSMGAEAIAAGICHALGPEDQVFGTYRSHAIYLAKTQDSDGFFAEMYGKESSLLKGKGGSMHLCSPKHGFMGTSAIVASGIPVAVGAAFANKRENNGKIVAVFFGDGAVEEGVFWESMNIACLMQLPILFICEDNGLAVHTFFSERRGYGSIVDIVSKFKCRVFSETATDAEVVYDLARKAKESANTAQMPCFIHLKYYRYLEHVGINKDFDAGYRQQEEFERYLAADPVNTQRKKMLDAGCPEDEIKKIEQDIDCKINDSIARAKDAPFADESILHEGVFG